MKDILFILCVEFVSSFAIAQFIMDYRKDRLVIASIELVTAILMLAMGICLVWQRTSEMIIG